MTVLVCLNYRTKEETLEFINGIVDYKLIDKIVLVDNHSEDGSFKYFKENIKNKKVDVLTIEKNLGFAGGNDFGLEHAKQYNPDYLIVSNPDASFKERIVERALELFKDNPKAGWVSFKCLSMDETFENPSINKFPKNVFSDYWELIWKTYKYKHYGINEVVKVDYMVTPLSFFRADAMYEIGMYDPTTFLYGEERILGYKFHQKGYEVIFDATTSYHHEGGTSTSISFESKAKLKFWLQSRKIYWFNHVKIGPLRKLELYILQFFAYLSRRTKAIIHKEK